MSNLNMRNHIIAFLVHGGILLVALILVLTTSCEQEPAPRPEPEPIDTFFREIKSSLDDAMADNVVIISVKDSIGEDKALARQIYQDLQSRLADLDFITIIEYPTSELEDAFDELGIEPAEGLSPEQAVTLSEQLGTGALIYASIESSTPDVHVKIYSAENGSVVFAETLSNWPLPVTRIDDFSTGGIEPVESEGISESGE